MTERLFSTMIIVIVTGNTLVVTFGQLVLTQENGPLGEQRERLKGAMDFREFTAELTGGPSSTNPSIFLSEILAATAQRAEVLRESSGEIDNDALSEDIEELAESVTGNADSVREQLDGAEFGSSDVVFAALNFDYSWKIFQAERIASEFAEDLTEDEDGLLDDLKTALLLFGPAREYIKTLYFQWALIVLSQHILYSAIPALAVAGIMLAVVDAGTFPGSTFGIDHIILVVATAFVVTLVPFMLFVSYVLRIFTIAKRTLAIDPLIPRRAEQ